MGNAGAHAVKPATSVARRPGLTAAAPVNDVFTAAVRALAQLGNRTASRTAGAGSQLPQRAALGNRQSGPAIEGAALRQGGSPLPAATRRFFEPRLGRDLGRVRVHEGPDAASLAGSLDARAFTHGEHVWLGKGEAAGPGPLLAHELAHVVQQTGPAAGEPVVARQGPARLPVTVPENYRASLFEDRHLRDILDQMLPDTLGRIGFPTRSCAYELVAKVLGFQYWLGRYILTPHWRAVAEAWFYETGPNPLVVTGNADHRNADIKSNAGFRELFGRWNAGERGPLPDGSILRDEGFRWRYELPPERSPGGGAAYNSTTHLLGTYDAFISPPASGGPHDVVVRNKSNWESGTRLPDDVVAYLLTVAPDIAFRSLWRDHPRGQAPCRPPSLGGDLEQEYRFSTP